MIELIAFIVLVVLGVFTLLAENRDILRFIYIPSFFIYILIVRIHGFYLGGYQEDIVTYCIEMQYFSFDQYYLREFVFWYGLHFVYVITQSKIITFLIFDLIWMHFLLKTINLNESSKLGKGLIVVLATSFPFLFGYENIYRQFLATIILMYSYSVLNISPRKSVGLFVVSIFIHNLSLFVLPIFIMRRFFSFKLGDRTVLSLGLSLLIVVLMPTLMFLKATDPTIINFSALYLLLFVLCFTFFLYKFREDVLYLVKIIPSLLPTTILMMGFVFLKQELIAERIGMLFIVFLITDLYDYSILIERKFNRILFRVILLAVFTVPVFVFSSSMMYLL